MINNPVESSNPSIDLSKDFNMSYQSLSDKIREMIRHDRGYSIVNSSDSGGIPSPIRESESFKKLFEYKESEANSDFNSRKVKKIEFSDTMTKENGPKKSKKANEKLKGEVNFTHSSIDRLIFSETDEIDNQINSVLENAGDGSIAETMKRNSEKQNINSNSLHSPEKQIDPYIEPSFENPEELSHEFKKYSLRSSVDEKFYGALYDKQLDLNDLQLPSINNSLIEYQQSRQTGNKHLWENTDIK